MPFTLVPSPSSFEESREARGLTQEQLFVAAEVPGEHIKLSDTRTHYIERLAAGQGFIFVEGWLRGSTKLIELQDLQFVLRGNGSELGAGQLGKLFSRPDLDSYRESMLARAFATVIYGPEAMAAATSYAILCDGVELASGVVTSPVPMFIPLGHIDILDANYMHGWVFDPGAKLQGRRPVLIIDDELTVALNLGERRADLNYNDSIGNHCFGFSLLVSELGAALRAADPSFTLCDGQEHSVALLCSGHEIDHRVFQYEQKINGKIERIHDNGLYGWAVDPNAPDKPITVELFIDDVRYATMQAAIDRSDLNAQGITDHGGGFLFELPPLTPNASGTSNLTVRPAFGKVELPGGPIEFGGVTPRTRYHGHILDTLPEPGASRVTVIVPIFNAPSDLALCIESVVRHTTGSARLLLIDDASPDPRVAEVLAGWQNWPGVEILRNPQNLGYTATINRGITLSAGDDVVLLNSDTIVGPGWLDGLRTAAYSSGFVGTVTAVSNNAGAFSVPEIGVENAFPTWFEVEDFARLVRHASPALMPALPTGNGFCMYMRRACIDAVGNFDEAAFPRGYGEENDLCMRAGRMGFLNLVDDRTFVYHKRSASFGEEREDLHKDGRRVVDERYPEYRVQTSQFSEDHGLLTARWRIRRALDQVRIQGAIPRPRVLYVLSTRTGGTPQTNDDLMEALADRYEPWVLRCDSKVLELSCRDSGSERVVETRRLERAIVMSSHVSGEYDGHVADLLIRYAFEVVHIRHIAWHGLGLTSVCRRLGVPVVFSFHDFYTICPQLKLLDENATFCGGHCTASEGDCEAELWPARSVPPLKHRFVHRWREMMGNALGQCDALVTTSPGARAMVLDAFPELVQKDFRIILHGRSFATMENLAALPTVDDKLRVLLPGNMTIAKGAAFVTAVADIDIHDEIEFHILGDKGDVAPRNNVILHGPYKREEFADRVRYIRPHIGAVLSIWPETYCHTLTETWACGLPVVAFKLGAVAERITSYGGGWLLDPSMTPQAFLEFLVALKRDVRAIRARQEEVLNWQGSCGRHYDNKAMAVAYDLLYREVLERRRSFRNPPREAELRPRTALVVAPRGRVSGEAPASTHIRILERTHNKLSRPVIFREVTASYPWDDANAGPADLLLIQRNAVKPFDVPDLLARCRSARLPIIVDVDDDLTAVPSDKDPDQRYRTGAESFKLLLKSAALVLVSTPALKDRLTGMADRIEVVPNRLSARLWATRLPVVKRAGETADGETPSRCRILYMGTITHDDDLEMIRPAIEALRAAGVCELHVVGGQAADADWFERVRIPDQAKNYPRFVPWFRSMARSYDLAVAPLRDAPFNLCKSDLKAMDYGAAGLAALVSDVAAFSEFRNSGWVMMVPNQPDAWEHALAGFCADTATRGRMARQARRGIQGTRVMRHGGEGFDVLITSVILQRA